MRAKIKEIKEQGEKYFVKLVFDNEKTRTYPTYDVSGISAGDELEDDDLYSLFGGEMESEALDRALGILATGPNSVKALYKKLRDKGFSEKCAEYAAKKCKELGYIDEEKQIRAFLSGVLPEKMWGRRKLTAYLLSRGYSSSVIAKAIFLAESEDELDFEKQKADLLAMHPCEDLNEKKKLLCKYGY